jgi:hypothetical protein
VKHESSQVALRWNFQTDTRSPTACYVGRLDHNSYRLDKALTRDSPFGSQNRLLLSGLFGRSVSLLPTIRRSNWKIHINYINKKENPTKLQCIMFIRYIFISHRKGECRNEVQPTTHKERIHLLNPNTDLNTSHYAVM